MLKDKKYKYTHLITFLVTISIAGICSYIVSRPTQEELDKHLFQVVSWGHRCGCAVQPEDLIKQGANVNATQEYGVTPLHRASAFGNPSDIKLLIRNGANVNAQASSMTTPLMQACQFGNLEAVKILLANGADPVIKDKFGHNALWHAKSGMEFDIEWEKKEQAKYDKMTPEEKKMTDIIQKENPSNPVQDRKAIINLLKNNSKEIK